MKNDVVPVIVGERVGRSPATPSSGRRLVRDYVVDGDLRAALLAVVCNQFERKSQYIYAALYIEFRVRRNIRAMSEKVAL